MTNPVMQALVNAKMREASVFGKWCILKGVPALPASPAAVAAFVRDCEPLIPVDKIWEAVSEVSQSHLSNGLADPTAGGQVASAMSAMARIDPPRSWPDPLKTRFKSLPYDLQIYVERHEREREKAVRRAQNEAATAKRKLGELEQPAKQEPKDGNIESQPAA